MQPMKIFGVAGWRSSGKTTLVTRLLPELIGRTISVSTMKHAHHEFDVDQPGKDSYEHRSAGAKEVLITSANRWALMHEHRDEPEATFESLLPRLQPVDLLLVEGFKKHAHDKLEVHRPSIGKPLLCSDDPHIVAIATDADLTGLTIPVLPLDDIAAIADFIIKRCELARG
jgi:molybdopterin-guanine dinucleotide biosynthesis adapter protein